MRLVFWSNNNIWNEYITHVLTVRRLSRSSWSVDYSVSRENGTVSSLVRNMRVSADNMWCEAL